MMSKFIDTIHFNLQQINKMPHKRRITSLFSLSIDYIAKNLSLIELETIEFLPPHCKTILLKKITTHPNYISKLPNNSLNSILRLLKHRNLAVINLNNFSELLTDECLEILKDCHQLQEIRLKNCNNFTSTGLKTFLANKPSLKIFICSNCTACNDDVLLESLSHCINLEYLDVRGCEVSDHGFIGMTNSVKSLQWLTVSNTKVTGTGLSVALNESLTDLIELRMDNCEKVTADVIQNIMKKCLKLKILTLNNCDTNGEVYEHSGARLKQINWTVSW